MHVLSKSSPQNAKYIADLTPMLDKYKTNLEEGESSEVRREISKKIEAIKRDALE